MASYDSNSCKCASSSTSSGIGNANESRKSTEDKKGLQMKKARPTSEGDSCFSFQGSASSPECEKLVLSKAISRAIVGRPAPHFEGKATYKCEFVDLALSDYLGKYVVLVFYALDFTLVCPSEIIAFSERLDEFRKMNTEIICCSVDSHFTHLAWINTPRQDGGVGKIKVPLLSDITHRISKKYGVYVPEWGHSLRGLFIIDERGILRQITINDLPVTRSIDETLRLVKLFQFTDKHDEVCSSMA